MQELNMFEKALVQALARDHECARPLEAPELDALRASKRSMTGSGFITEIADTADSFLYPRDASFRWGAGYVAVLNDAEQVGMVVYVEHGRVSALEAYTFGGKPWPDEIVEVDVRRVTSAAEPPSR